MLSDDTGGQMADRVVPLVIDNNRHANTLVWSNTSLNHRRAVAAPAAIFARSLRLGDADPLSLEQQPSLEAGDRDDDLGDHPAGRTCRVDPEIQDADRHPLPLQSVEHFAEVGSATAEPVQAGDDQDVAITDEVETRLKLRPGTDCGHLLLEDPLDAQPAELFELIIEAGGLIDG
jgi:hypothetical protein